MAAFLKKMRLDSLNGQSAKNEDEDEEEEDFVVDENRSCKILALADPLC